MTLFHSAVSLTVASASAWARTNQVPPAVPLGMVTVVDAVLTTPAASAGTGRLPSGTSPASSVASAERKNRVVDGPVPPAPWFFVVSVTVMAPPAPAVAGISSAETTRSPPTWTAVEAVLFVSMVSPTAPPASAAAIR